MTDKEKIIQEIERRIHFLDGMVNTDFGRSSLDTLNKVLDFINSLPAEQQSEDMEKFIQDLIDKYPVNKESVPNDSLNDYYQGLRFGVLQGAQWQKEQIMKSAIDAKIVNDESSGCVVDCEQGCLVLEPHTYPIGQKLKILIIKEDEQ